MSETDVDVNEIQNMLEQAVYQQLFNTQDKDRIMGKNPEYTMQFTGIKQLLAKFLKELKDNIELVYDVNISDFLKIFEKRFTCQLSGTEQRIENNFEGMGGKEVIIQQKTILVYMVLTKLVEALRDHGYALWGNQRIIEEYEKETGKKFNKDIQESVNHLAAINNKDISLLYNLSFITLLADSYGVKNKITAGKRLVTMKVNKILKAIL